MNNFFIYLYEYDNLLKFQDSKKNSFQSNFKPYKKNNSTKPDFQFICAIYTNPLVLDNFFSLRRCAI